MAVGAVAQVAVAQVAAQVAAQLAQVVAQVVAQVTGARQTMETVSAARSG